MIFVKKIIFLIMRKVMLILRFPHSFGVWGSWGRSNSIHFAVFRGFRGPEQGFCLISIGSDIVLVHSSRFHVEILCDLCSEYEHILTGGIDSRALTYPSVMSKHSLAKPCGSRTTTNKAIAMQSCTISDQKVISEVVHRCAPTCESS